MTPGRRYGYQRGRGLSSYGGRVEPGCVCLRIRGVTSYRVRARAARCDLVVLAAMARERLPQPGAGRGPAPGRGGGGGRARGGAGSRERARALIMTGDVLVAGRPETKPGTLIDPAAEIALRAA